MAIRGDHSGGQNELCISMSAGRPEGGRAVQYDRNLIAT